MIEREGKREEGMRGEQGNEWKNASASVVSENETEEREKERDNSPPIKLWMESRMEDTFWHADHSSLRMSRQMYPSWSTFGWKIFDTNLTRGAEWG